MYALQAQQKLLIIYELLFDSGKMPVYTGPWLIRFVPTVGEEWTTIEEVKLPEDTEMFTSVVLAGLLSYFVGKEEDIWEVEGITEDVEHGKIKLKDGKTQFPLPINPNYAPISDIDKDKAYLRWWLKVHGINRDGAEDTALYKAALYIIPKIKEDYQNAASKLMDMWPEDIPYFNSRGLDAEMEELSLGEGAEGEDVVEPVEEEVLADSDEDEDEGADSEDDEDESEHDMDGEDESDEDKETADLRPVATRPQHPRIRLLLREH